VRLAFQTTTKYILFCQLTRGKIDCAKNEEENLNEKRMSADLLSDHCHDKK